MPSLVLWGLDAPASPSSSYTFHFVPLPPDQEIFDAMRANRIPFMNMTHRVYYRRMVSFFMRMRDVLGRLDWTQLDETVVLARSDIFNRVPDIFLDFLRSDAPPESAIASRYHHAIEDRFFVLQREHLAALHLVMCNILEFIPKRANENFKFAESLLCDFIRLYVPELAPALERQTPLAVPVLINQEKYSVATMYLEFDLWMLYNPDTPMRLECPLHYIRVSGDELRPGMGSDGSVCDLSAAFAHKQLQHGLRDFLLRTGDSWVRLRIGDLVSPRSGGSRGSEGSECCSEGSLAARTAGTSGHSC